MDVGDVIKTGLDNGEHVESVCLLINQNAQIKYYVNVGIGI